MMQLTRSTVLNRLIGAVSSTRLEELLADQMVGEYVVWLVHDGVGPAQIPLLLPEAAGLTESMVIAIVQNHVIDRLVKAANALRGQQ